MPPPPTRRSPAAAGDSLTDAKENGTRAGHSGPLDGLDRVYRTEAPKLAAFFRRRLFEQDDTHDCVQETFSRLAGFMSTNPLREPGPYLQRIARNLLFERTRRRKTRQASIHVSLTPELEPAIAPDQTHRIEADDVIRAYRRALDELPEKTRQVFLLHRVDELSYKEIGERLGISIPTVQYHFGRALAHIDAALERE